jgi:hypothetical protein
LFSGLRFTNTTTDLQNNVIDNAGTAVIQDFTVGPPGPSIGLTYAPNGDANNLNERINTSNPPVFITLNDLDIESAETKAGSCKLFYNMHYQIDTESEWKPAIGLGGEVEWGHRSDNDSRHGKSAFSQWSIWAHCSFGF